MKWRNFCKPVLVTATLILSVLAGALTAHVAYAETPEHLTDRVLTEIEQQHPDVLKTCDPSVWVRSEPFLFPLSKMLHQPIGRVSCAFSAWKFERGIQFEQLYGRPPTLFNWQYEYADDQEAFRALFDVGDGVFAVNEWTSPSRYFRYKIQFCSEDWRVSAKCW